MKLTNELYDRLKPVALVWLPLIGTLYFALATIWGLPHAQDVVGSITAIDTFLGAGLHISSKSGGGATDGSLVVDKTGPKDVYTLDVTTPFEKMAQKSTITLKVTAPPKA